MTPHELKLVNDLFAQHGMADTILTSRPFSGGYSNLTYQLTGQNASYVLRRPPGGSKQIKGGHDMGREYRLLIALQQAGFGFAPSPLFTAGEVPDLFDGDTFYVMELLEGFILRPAKAATLLEKHDPALMRKRGQSLAEMQARLHAIPLSGGLEHIGKPHGYVERQVNGWRERYEKAKTSELMPMETLGSWLAANIPPQATEATLLHNDYKFDNVVYAAAESAELIGILDWEMATIGDPLMDLGTTLSYWVEAAENDFMKQINVSWLPGNLTRKEYLAHYTECSGRDTTNILYYYLFGLYKNAVVLQQIYSRYHRGFTTDARFATLDKGVAVLALTGLNALEKGSI